LHIDPCYISYLGYLLFKEFGETQCDEPVPQLAFYEAVRKVSIALL
jgi:beta-adrenergic-receptor kinase